MQSSSKMYPKPGKDILEQTAIHNLTYQLKTTNETLKYSDLASFDINTQNEKRFTFHKLK